MLTHGLSDAQQSAAAASFAFELWLTLSSPARGSIEAYEAAYGEIFHVNRQLPFLVFSGQSMSVQLLQQACQMQHHGLFAQTCSQRIGSGILWPVDKISDALS